MIAWLDEFVSDCATRLAQLPPTHAVRTYLAGRAVSPAYQASYRVGWLEVPTAQHATPEFWTWLQRYGWESYVFPLTDPWGAVTGVVLRSLPEKRYQNYIAYPKDLCPPCFGLHTALPVMFQTQQVVLVEGVFDYFAVRPFTPAVLAQLTSIPSLLLRRLLARYVTKVEFRYSNLAGGGDARVELFGYEKSKSRGTVKVKKKFKVKGKLVPREKDRDHR